MGTTTDDRFRAVGGASGVFNYTARGVCEVGYTMFWPVNTFLVGAGLNGVDFGVHATAGPVGDFSMMPPATGYADPAGVEGASALFTGTAGLSTFGTGVYGHKSLPSEDISSIPVAQFAGVLGTAIAWPGVVGWSTIGRGVKGLTYSGEAGVLGQAEQGRGVLGVSGQGAFSGVEGRSGDRGPPPGMGIPNVAGVLGTAVAHPGVMGTSTRLMGVYGFSTDNAGVVGQTANPNSFGGFFAGNVMVTGNLTVAGSKSAAVPFPDGTNRTLYCMESPELWFEDFGTAKLRRGRAVVNLDADFGIELGLGRRRLRIGWPKGLRHEARRLVGQLRHEARDLIAIARRERHGASSKHRCDLHRRHGRTGRTCAFAIGFGQRSARARRAQDLARGRAPLTAVWPRLLRTGPRRGDRSGFGRANGESIALGSGARGLCFGHGRRGRLGAGGERRHHGSANGERDRTGSKPESGH